MFFVAMLPEDSETNAGTNAGMTSQHIKILCNKLNGIRVDLSNDSPIMMSCNNNTSVIMANMDDDVKSMNHCERHYKTKNKNQISQ